MWWAVLVSMLALPLGLSAAYKAFVGGESTIQINSADYIPDASFYGFWRPPGMETVTFDFGPTFLTNGTLPFRMATSPELDNVEPPLPAFPQPYGSNVLLLSSESTAILDFLPTDYLRSVQGLLQIGEFWVVSAPVSATVATFDRSKTEDPDEFSSTYVELCKNWSMIGVPLYNNWSISLLNADIVHSNQSIQYVGIHPGFPGGLECEELPSYNQSYNVERWQCQGTWRIIRSGFDLVHGSCGGGKLPWIKQQIFE